MQQNNNINKSNVDKPVHSGHRERIKNKFLKYGLDKFDPHEVLELLLFYGIPLKDTNVTAHLLLKKFGSLSAVFDAPFHELIKIEGIGKNSATLIKIIPQICRIYQENLDKDKKRIFSYDEAGNFLVKKFIGRKNEFIILMLLDSKNQVIYCDIASEGTATTANIYVKKIVRLAVQYNAVYAILSHNHPSGECIPSQQDLNSTVWIYEALKTVEVKLIDHIIVSDNDFLSIAKSGILPNIFDVEFDVE